MPDMAAFRLEVVRPTLIHLQAYHPQMWSQAAENLIVGTAAHESAGLKHLKQIGGGPGLGYFQIEPATASDIWFNYLEARPELGNLVAALLWPWPKGPMKPQNVWNFAYATAIARLVYWRRPEPLPDADDIDGLGRYWKDHYNTAKGGGTAARFVSDYNRYVKE